MTKSNYLFSVLFVFLTLTLTSQSRVADMISVNESSFKSIELLNPFEKSDLRNVDGLIDDQILKEKTVLRLGTSFNTEVLKTNPELLKIAVPMEGRDDLVLHLNQIQITSDGFQLFESSDRETPVHLTAGKYYWGVVEGLDNSLAAINVFKGEISGMISTGKNIFTIGKLADTDYHMLFKEDDIEDLPMYSCFTDDMDYKIGEYDVVEPSRMDENNCVQMYVEVDKDVYDDFGTTAATANYITGAFSQVAIMYANEFINFEISELVIWNTTDPYSGPSTLDYLNQFRDNLSGNYNGDLAHLVGYAGGGGIAYVGVLCNSFYGVGYSAINSTYNNIPTYSWTVNVLTHEIGHNLGSPHTHNCSWSGGAIDGCGPAAGYSEGCDGPIPSAGTVMSYCHLLSGVGIDPNNGFGPQPGDLIRSNVYNATCLSSCSSCPNVGDACDDGDACTTGDVINASCNCVGTYTDNDSDGFCAGDDPNDNDPCVPVDCPDCTDVTIEIVLDNYPGETTWEIVDDSGAIIASGGPYGSFPTGSTVTSNVCLNEGCYDFTIFDSYGDGICCGYGFGSYSVYDANNTYASGGNFDFSETTNFCMGGGGSDCDWEVVDNNNFDSGWGIWNDGGSDCRRSASDAAYAYSGNYCVRIRDNTNTSTTTTDNMNLSSYDLINVAFTYYPRSMDNANEDFWLQVSTNGGASYTTVEEWNKDDEFVNNVREFDDVTIDGPFTSNTRLRFRCDASGNVDFIYLDDIVIQGYTCGSNASGGNIAISPIAAATEVAVYPNPVSKDDELRIETSYEQQIQSLEIISLTGQRVHTEIWNSEETYQDISLESMRTGTYFLKLMTTNGVITKKFIVIE